MKSRLQTLPRYVTTHLTYKLFEVLFQVSDPNALPHFMPLASGPLAQSFREISRSVPWVQGGNVNKHRLRCAVE